MQTHFLFGLHSELIPSTTKHSTALSSLFFLHLFSFSFYLFSISFVYHHSISFIVFTVPCNDFSFSWSFHGLFSISLISTFVCGSFSWTDHRRWSNCIAIKERSSKQPKKKLWALMKASVGSLQIVWMVRNALTLLITSSLFRVGLFVTNGKYLSTGYR